MRDISLTAERLSAAQELCSIDLVRLRDYTQFHIVYFNKVSCLKEHDNLS